MRLSKHILAGTIFIGLGVAAILMSETYRMGSAVAMGPGYFPRLLGGALIVLGALAIGQAVRARTDSERLPRPPLRQLVLIPLSAASFAFLIEPAGLAVAVGVSALLACIGGFQFRLWEALAIAATLVMLTSVLFVLLLDLPLSILPPR